MTASATHYFVLETAHAERCLDEPAAFEGFTTLEKYAFSTHSGKEEAEKAKTEHEDQNPGAGFSIVKETKTRKLL